MTDLTEILQRYGKKRELAPGEVLFRQGSPSDGLYYLEQGRLGVYREEQGVAYLLSEVSPGDLVGELGVTTGWSRTATVKAEEHSCVFYISEGDFRRALDESPALAVRLFCLMGERLTEADVARISLGRSYRQADDRIQALSSQKEQLEELLRLREELSAMIVHDLRNPLTVIASGLELLEHAPLSESGAEYVDSVRRMMSQATRRMRRLVDTVLDIARLEEGEMTLRRVPVDLGALMAELMAEERPLAVAKDIALEGHVPEDTPPLQADPDVLQRVLINLLDNALKFTPRGERVAVEVQPGAEEVRVAVTDAGPGIPPQERERIFEKFTQIRGREGRRRGSGLGLTFCRMAVEAHGGRIWVEDGPEGSGSRFVFTLPRR